MSSDNPDLATLQEFEKQLQEADVEAKRAIKKRDSLRQVVLGLRSYLDLDRPERLFGVNDAAIKANLNRVREKSESYVIASSFGNDSVWLPAAAAAGATGAAGPPGPRTSTPRGRDAVLIILSESGEEMHIDAIAQDAVARGWMADVANPRNALSAAAKRLVTDGKIEATGRARYRYPKNQLPMGATGATGAAM